MTVLIINLIENPRQKRKFALIEIMHCNLDVTFKEDYNKAIDETVLRIWILFVNGIISTKTFWYGKKWL